jgi:NAD(P)-dependent dehydrogenase (short-subunit alcohol dehydrogenase family)
MATEQGGSRVAASSDLPPEGLSIFLTGATSGIGRLAARALARKGVTLLLHGRSKERVDLVVDEAEGAGARAIGLVADLASLQETAKLAGDALAASFGRIDVLINNAGVGIGRDRTQRETTRDGFELRLGVNYLAPFLLSRALLAQGAPTRTLVNVASMGQEAILLDDLQSLRLYDGVLAYRRSKLALIMLTLDLAEGRRRPTANAVHPGKLLDTGMVRDAGMTPLGSASRGAEVIVHVLKAGLAGETTGIYFDELTPKRAHAQAYDLAIRRALRERTLELTRSYLPLS